MPKRTIEIQQLAPLGSSMSLRVGAAYAGGGGAFDENSYATGAHQPRYSISRQYGRRSSSRSRRIVQVADI